MSLIKHISLDFWGTIATPNKEFRQRANAFIAERYDTPVEKVDAAYRKIKQDIKDNETNLKYQFLYPIDIAMIWLREFAPQYIGFSHTNGFDIATQIGILFNKYPPIIDIELIRLLGKLRTERNITTSVLSNVSFICGTFQIDVLADLQRQLGDAPEAFDFFLSSDDELVGNKPHPKAFYELYRRALGLRTDNEERFVPNFSVDNIMHIGDDLLCDVAGAKAIGMQSVHVSNPADTLNYLRSMFVK